MLNRNLGTALHGAPSVAPIGITNAGTLYYRSYKPTSDISHSESRDPVIQAGSHLSQRPYLSLAPVTTSCRAGHPMVEGFSTTGYNGLLRTISFTRSTQVVRSVLHPNVASAAICWSDNGTSILCDSFCRRPVALSGPRSDQSSEWRVDSAGQTVGKHDPSELRGRLGDVGDSGCFAHL